MMEVFREIRSQSLTILFALIKLHQLSVKFVVKRDASRVAVNCFCLTNLDAEIFNLLG